MERPFEIGPSATPGPEPWIRKIAVLRANGIGDLMFAMPALEALRHAYPSAEIVLLATDWHQAFLEGRPGPVNRVVPVPPTAGIRDEPGRHEDRQDLDSFFREMQSERFDLAVQLHGGGRHSNPFVRRLGARMTIGLQAPDAPPLDRVLPYVYFQPEIVRYLEVVSLVGAAPVRLEPRVEVTPRDIDLSLAVVPPMDGRPIAVLHPAASDPRRRWPPQKFAEVAGELAAEGAFVAIVGVPADAALVAEVVRASRGAAHDLCGRLSLSGLAGLLSRSAVVVSNDSGPLHLAAAVGAATVGIFWCGNLITAGLLTRSWHRPFLSWRLDCPVCGVDTTRGSCPHDTSFVADVPVLDVANAAREFLARRGARGVAGQEADSAA